MSKIRKLAGDTVLYGLGSFVPRMMNFLLVPLHTRIFNPEQYGAITYLYAFVAFLNIVYTFGMETAYFRFATRPGANEQHVFKVAQTAVLLISLVFTLIFIGSSDFISSGLHIENGRRYIVWLALILFVDASVALPFARLRLQRKTKTFVLAKTANVIVLVGLNLLLLKIFYDPHIGIGYVFISNLIANALYIPIFYKSLFTWRPKIDKEIFPKMVSYSFPIMITGLAGMTNEMFSRITLSWWLPDGFYPGKSDDYALGVFGACYKYAVFMNLAIQAFRFAAEPFFFSESSDKNSPILFARVNHYFVIVCSIILLGVGLNLDILKYFLGSSSYWDGLSIVPLLLTAYLFLGMYYNFSVWFKLTDKTYYGTIITLGGALLTVLLNFILIPYYGYYGSALAALGCYLTMAVACYITGQRHYPIPYKIIYCLFYILIAFGLVMIPQNFEHTPEWQSITFHNIIIGVYVFAVVLFERKNRWSTADHTTDHQ